jgi:hypothetical protein
MSTSTLWFVLLASNGACVLLGYLFGRMVRATVRIEETMVEDAASPPPGRRSRDTTMRIMAAVVALIGVVTATFGVVVIRDVDQLNGCVVGYSNALADTLDRRAGPQQEATLQLDRVMSAIMDAYKMTPVDGREHVRTAIEAYVEARNTARAFLAENPLPDAPRDACAELLG